MKKITLALIAVFVAFQAAAYAEMVSGKVASIDAANNTLSISTTNAETKAEEKVTISVKPETTFSGIQALAELKEGQEVPIDAAKDSASGNWDAKSVEVKAAEAKAAY